MFYNSLPLFANMINKGCMVNTECIFCGFDEENVTDLFFDCWRSNAIWRSLGIDNKAWQTSQQWSIDDRIWYIITEEEPNILRIILMGFWIIWFNRKWLMEKHLYLLLPAVPGFTITLVNGRRRTCLVFVSKMVTQEFYSR